MPIAGVDVRHEIQSLHRKQAIWETSYRRSGPTCFDAMATPHPKLKSEIDRVTKVMF